MCFTFQSLDLLDTDQGLKDFVDSIFENPGNFFDEASMHQSDSAELTDAQKKAGFGSWDNTPRPPVNSTSLSATGLCNLDLDDATMAMGISRSTMGGTKQEKKTRISSV